jgi:hypothetical protein
MMVITEINYVCYIKASLMRVCFDAFSECLLVLTQEVGADPM